MASEKITALVEEVKGLTVLELSELVHTLEDVFGRKLAPRPRSSNLSRKGYVRLRRFRRRFFKFVYFSPKWVECTLPL